MDGLAAVIVTAIGALIAGIFQFVGTRRHRRSNIKDDLEILSQLPGDSPARAPLLAHIEASIGSLVRSEVDQYREWSGVGAAVFLAALAGGVGLFAARGGTWMLLWLPVVFLGLLAIVGFAESIRRRSDSERDSAKAVREQRTAERKRKRMHRRKARG